MNSDRGTLAKLALLLVLATLLAGCGGGGRDGDDEAGGDTAATTSESGGDLSGRIEADGSSTVGPYTTAAAESFQDVEPGVQVTVGVSGTGGGFERFCRGETDLSNASRAIKEEEIAACEQEGIEYVEFQVANDALTVVVNPENDWATCLTVEQLKTIWNTGSKVTNWNQVDASFPGPAAEALRPRNRLRHVRLLHRRDQRRGRREPLRLRRQRGRQRDRPGRRRREGRPRLLRLLLLRGEPGQPQGGRDRRRRRLCRAECRDGAGRDLQAALAPALHLREDGVASSDRRSRRSYSTSSTTKRPSPRAPSSCR